MSKNCVQCGSSLKLGKFAHRQELCWECFRAEIEIMLERIDQYPSWLWHKRDQHKDILKTLRDITAETYGEKW